MEFYQEWKRIPFLGEGNGMDEEDVKKGEWEV